MNTIVNGIKGRLRGVARDLAYSPRSRQLARKVVEDSSPSAAKVREVIESRGHGSMLRRLASQPLPQGTYFAKLTIPNWARYRGRRFQLLEGEKVVYGNEIEPPAKGFPLEYRNIMVTSDDPADFRLDIGAPFELKIGRGAFTTAEQVRYDERYGVEQHGDLFYSLRGNTTNPTRVFVTFPGFGPSTSRISYAVSYLKNLTDEDLSDTLMICFQDRYLVAGTYMLVDNAGEALHDRVRDAITGILDRHGIPEERLMMFGASKGGSIAVIHARSFPRAQLLLVVPQMNLPYYLDKPFFRDNLLRLEAVWESPQPGDLLRQYFAEGRRIDYFYTESDEQSNNSLIEFAQDVEGLRKVRVDGKHAEVARRALPAILSVIRGFLRGKDGLEGGDVACDQAVAFGPRGGEHGIALQLRLGDDAAVPRGAGTNLFVEGRLGRTRALHLVAPHTYDFIRCTTPPQRLVPELHAPDQLSRIVVVGPGDAVRTGPLPPREGVGLDALAPAPVPGTAPLDLSAGEDVRDHAIMVAPTQPVATFSYTVRGSAGAPLLVIAARQGDAVAGASEWPVQEDRLTVVAVPTGPRTGLALLAHRVAIAARAKSIDVVVQDPDVPDVQLAALRRLYGPTITVEDRRESGAVPSV